MPLSGECCVLQALLLRQCPLLQLLHQLLLHWLRPLAVPNPPLTEHCQR